MPVVRERPTVRNVRIANGFDRYGHEQYFNPRRIVLPIIASSIILVVLSSAAGYSYGLSNGQSNPSNFQTDLHQQIIAPSSLPGFIRSAATDRCGKLERSDQDDYDFAIHIGGLFILLIVATTACAFPILILKFPKLRIPTSWLFAIRHLGTGVLVATAFVHLLPTAFESLTDDCLPDFWIKDYPPMAGAITLGAVLFVVCIEMIFNSARCARHIRSTRDWPDSEHEHDRRSPAIDRGPNSNRHAFCFPEPTGDISDVTRTAQTDPERNMSDDVLGTPEAIQLTSAQQRQKSLVQCSLLEASILCHSIFIGMALSVTLGNEYIVFLVAIIFHQACEGLALGARIAAVTWDDDAIQPWLMAIAYGLITPIGQALGIATRTLYDPESTVGLLTTGIFNAISAGLLVWASLVELLAEDFMSEESWRILRGKRRFAAFFLVCLGAFVMALIGAWA